jgi:hypothetical protein
MDGVRHDGTFDRVDLGTFSPAPIWPAYRRVDAVIAALLFAVGAVLLAAGPVMILRGRAGRGQIQHELAEQRIVFPQVDALPTALTRYAGLQVKTGEQARAFSDLIASHVAQATAGRTYAQIADEWQAGGRTDQRLARLRETAFMGQTLRGSLLSAYQGWQITTLVAGLGCLLTAIGVVFVALGAAWR